MTLTPETLTRAERSALLYAETAMVDYGGQSTMNLKDIQVGSMLAVSRGYSSMHPSPRVNHDIYTVVRLTETQAVARHVGPFSEIRVRLKDGHIIGSTYKSAMIATPELVTQTKAEVAMVKRHLSARQRIDDLNTGQPVLRKMTTEQLEALADAWQRVKSMVPTS